MNWKMITLRKRYYFSVAINLILAIEVFDLDYFLVVYHQSIVPASCTSTRLSQLLPPPPPPPPPVIIATIIFKVIKRQDREKGTGKEKSMGECRTVQDRCKYTACKYFQAC